MMLHPLAERYLSRLRVEGGLALNTIEAYEAHTGTSGPSPMEEMLKQYAQYGKFSTSGKPFDTRKPDRKSVV